MIQFQDTAKGPAVPALDPQSIISDMADAMRELAFTGTTIDKTALRLKGFTGRQIDAHWEDACDLANSCAVRKVA